MSPSTPPPTPPRPPRTLTGLESFALRTDIRVGQKVGPLVVYGNYDDGTSGTVDAVWTSSAPDVVAIDEEGFAVGVGVGTAVLTATFESFAADLDFSVEDPNPRSTKDRPDDIGGPQIHFIYAVPSDWEDRNRDRFGEVERSARAIQNWLQEQTGQRLRLDTYEGRVDVSFLRVSFTHQTGDGFGANLVTHLRRELAPVGLRGDKMPVFYYEGSSIGVCGSASYERGGAVYVGPGCSDAELGIDEQTASTYEVVMAHELFHVFGAVSSCAPNWIEGAHVDDVENDLMFQGVDRQPRGGETFIDVGRDDYYGHGRSDCLDVARSRFLEPALGAALPVEVRLAPGDWPLRCGMAH